MRSFQLRKQISSWRVLSHIFKAEPNKNSKYFNTEKVARSTIYTIINAGETERVTLGIQNIQCQISFLLVHMDLFYEFF